MSPDDETGRAATLILGVRLYGQRRVLFAVGTDPDLRWGQPVLVDVGGAERPGEIVVAPGQLLEYHLAEPSARIVRALSQGEAEAARRASLPVASAGRELLESLELPPELLRSMGVLDEPSG